MKDYKRLTKWSELGTLHVFDINGKEIPLYDVSPVDTDNLAGRLAKLEDKIESREIDYVADRDKQIARLTAENAELRATLSKMETVEKELKARLEKAIELPCKIGDIVYQTDADGLRIFESTVKNIIFETSSIAFDEQAIGESIFLTEEAVKEKMKKLQEKKQ